MLEDPPQKTSMMFPLKSKHPNDFPIAIVGILMSRDVSHHPTGDISSPTDVWFGDVKPIPNSWDINPKPCVEMSSMVDSRAAEPMPPSQTPGVAEAGVVPTAVPCFKSHEPSLGSKFFMTSFTISDNSWDV